MEIISIITDPNAWGSLTDRIQAFSSVVSLLLLMWSLRSLTLTGKQNKLLKEQNEAIKEQNKLTRLQMSDANMPQFEGSSILPQYSINFVPGAQTVLFQLQNIGATAYKISMSTPIKDTMCSITPLECPIESYVNLAIDTKTFSPSTELVNPMTVFISFENFLGDKFIQRAILFNRIVTCTNVEREVDILKRELP